MRIVAPQPYLSDLITSLGGEPIPLPVISPRTAPDSRSLSLPMRVLLGGDERVAAVVEAAPSLIISAKVGGGEVSRAALEEEWQSLTGHETKFFVFSPRTLEEVFMMFEGIGKAIQREFQAHGLVNRMKAQLSDWVNNFYPRMKNKRVLVLSDINPFTAAGLWIPDIVKQCGALPLVHVLGQSHSPITWKEIRIHRPDVLIISLKGESLTESSRSFRVLEQLDGWEDLPAVKRGEVIFADGEEHFYLPGLQLFQSIGIIVSAIAGLESGYITPRDLFFRLRWLEIHRHKV